MAGRSCNRVSLPQTSSAALSLESAPAAQTTATPRPFSKRLSPTLRHASISTRCWPTKTATSMEQPVPDKMLPRRSSSTPRN